MAQTEQDKKDMKVIHMITVSILSGFLAYCVSAFCTGTFNASLMKVEVKYIIAGCYVTFLIMYRVFKDVDKNENEEKK